jgi:16S rRNA (adenine1518-N6/adenine1519-N6)-dimethyltransferase
LQLEKVVACAFNQRRKMLKSSLKPLFTNPIAVLNHAEIDPSKRPEELSIEEFCRLAFLLSSK